MVNGQFMCSRFFHQSKGLFMRLEPLILSTLTIQNSVTTQELREVCRSVEKVDKEIDKAILLLEKEKLITRVSEPTVKNTSNYVGPGGLSAEQASFISAME
ncbi:hypothetical protein K7432_000058 [Basidiobolus ranarum]|uniref:Uncharacterized protein n=1 Tax=Basidiobolus ranarum TaxID=34480 RepID=A0ABR2X580_9FUNG